MHDLQTMKPAQTTNADSVAVAQADFITRGLASLAKSKKSDEYVDADAILDRLERKLAAAKVRQGAALIPRRP